MTLVWIATIFLILLGLAGTIIPVLPGAGLIFTGALLYSFFTDFQKVEIFTLVILGAVALLSYIFEYLASAYGAKKIGSTKYGVWGSLIFGILGMMVGNIFGLVIGIFLGAIISELIFAGKGISHSLKVGLGSVLGFLGGVAMKAIFGIAMAIIFFWSVFV